MRICRKVVFKARCRGVGRRVKRNDRREIELSAPKLERPLPAEDCRLPALPEQLAWLVQSVRIAGLSPEATGRSRLRLGTAYLRMWSAVSSACDHIYKDVVGPAAQRRHRHAGLGRDVRGSRARREARAITYLYTLLLAR